MLRVVVYGVFEELVSQPMPSPVSTLGAPHTLAAPRLPCSLQGKSRNLVLGGRRVAVVKSGSRELWVSAEPALAQQALAESAPTSFVVVRDDVDDI